MAKPAVLFNISKLGEMNEELTGTPQADFLKIMGDFRNVTLPAVIETIRDNEEDQGTIILPGLKIDMIRRAAEEMTTSEGVNFVAPEGRYDYLLTMETELVELGNAKVDWADVPSSELLRSEVA